MIWDWVKIEDIKSAEKYSLVGGPFGSDLSGKHYSESGVPVIRGGNLPFHKRFDITDLVYVSEKKAKKLISNTAYPGDIIFTQRGTLGQVGIASSDFEKYIISQSQMKLTVDKLKADALYVYYYFKTEECVKRIENVALSSGVPHTNLGILQNFKIPLPPLPTQQKIASILSAYDDLIENNTQRIQLLEEMAEEIYKEWFVRLRFPGYQNTKIVDGVPKGWAKVVLGSRFIISLGGTPSRDNDKYWNGTIPWINSGMVNDLRVINASEYITELGLAKSATKLLPKKTTLLAITGATLGQVSLLEIDSCTNQSIVGIKDESNEQDEFVFLTMKTNIQALINYAGGGAQQHINKNIVEEYEIIIGDIKTMAEFSSVIKPLFNLISNLLFKNTFLQQTRDLLLPRLISGKLSVEDLNLESIETNPAFDVAAEPKPDYK